MRFSDVGKFYLQGYTEVKKRSLLTSMENYVTLLLEGGKPMFTPSFTFGTLRRFIPEDKVDGVQGLALTADGQGAVFFLMYQSRTWMHFLPVRRMLSM